MEKSQLVDYTNNGFMMAVISGGKKIYASVNAELYNDQMNGGAGLEPSGSYHVYLVHPNFGSLQFQIFKAYLAAGEHTTQENEDPQSIEKWVSDTPELRIPNELIDLIGAEIDNRKEKESPPTSMSSEHVLENVEWSPKIRVPEPA